MKQNILKQLRPHEKLPQVLLEEPYLREGLEFYWMAFWDLHNERQVGMTIGRIGWIAIKTYAMHYNCNELEFEELLMFISAMDNAFLQWNKEQT